MLNPRIYLLPPISFLKRRCEISTKMYIRIKIELVIEATPLMLKNNAKKTLKAAVIYNPSIDLNQIFLSKKTGKSPSFAKE